MATTRTVIERDGTTVLCGLTVDKDGLFIPELIEISFDDRWEMKLESTDFFANKGWKLILKKRKANKDNGADDEPPAPTIDTRT